MKARSADIAPPISSPWTISPAQHRDRVGGQVLRADHAGPNGVVDVMVDVGDPVHQADDPALQRGRLGGPARVAADPIADRFGQVQPLAVALQHVDDPDRVLVVQERRSEPLGQAVIERLLADVAEGRVPQIVSETDRLDQVLIE
jgi:hypothetical protein